MSDGTRTRGRRDHNLHQRVVEADPAHAGRVARRLEAPRDLCAIQGLAQLRVAVGFPVVEVYERLRHHG
jgi:hypothetical protein